MVAPVTGPFTRTSGSAALNSMNYRYARWYRQRRPYGNNPLSYEKRDVEVVYNSQTNQNCILSINSVNDEQINNSAAYMRAYKKLVSALGDNAGIGINVAQWKQSEGMLKNRAIQLTNFTYALIRRNPVWIARSLGINLKRTKKVLSRKSYDRPVEPGKVPTKAVSHNGPAKSLSDLWLEFHFGWEPLVKDIYTCMEVLEEPLPSTRIKGRGTEHSNFVWSTGTPASRVTQGNVESNAQIGANVRVESPNKRLLQQMGLANPAQVVWDAVPFSFVLDWFFDVNTFLGSFSDFAGLDVQQPYVSRKVHTQLKESWIPCSFCSEAEKNVYLSWNSDAHGSLVTRTVGSIPIPWPTLTFTGFKPTRALTAVTLLVQKLASIR